MTQGALNIIIPVIRQASFSARSSSSIFRAAKTFLLIARRRSLYRAGNSPGGGKSGDGFRATCRIRDCLISPSFPPPATANSQGWVFPQEGALRASSRISRSVSRGTFRGENARILFLLLTASVISIFCQISSFHRLVFAPDIYSSLFKLARQFPRP